MRLDINSDEFDFLLRRILLAEVGFAEGKEAGAMVGGKLKTANVETCIRQKVQIYLFFK